MLRIINLSTGFTMVDNVINANSFSTRFTGLSNKNNLQEGEGLILRPCKINHTFGMKFPIDVIFLSKHYTVVCIIENLPSNCISPFIKTAYSVLELPVGTIQKTSTQIGDQLLFVD